MKKKPKKNQGKIHQKSVIQAQLRGEAVRVGEGKDVKKPRAI